MKQILLFAFFALVFAVACKNTGTEAAAPAADTTMMTTTETMTAAPDTMAMAAFACPMHPEVTGKEGDKCSKCGMDLVAVKKEEPGHEGHDH
ncbi:MAG TPA: heavy metal-binding domain-containing protein [Saprospiraceae bacterium]|nr:heavy metal-binding domain-containing protein [Saprospiraceae bacterium]HNT21088.1 heavy metal-binding domain-containing protein [Saprospiraceae bacterium]